MSSRLYWQQLERAYRARSVVWLVCGLILLTFVWASLAQLDEVVVGEGKVVPAHAVQKIQSLEGGILQLMQVYEGQIVEVGAELPFGGGHQPRELCTLEAEAPAHGFCLGID